MLIDCAIMTHDSDNSTRLRSNYYKSLLQLFASLITYNYFSNKCICIKYYYENYEPANEFTTKNEIF